MASTSVDHVTLDTAGLIKESVMNQIWDISKIPLPLTDAIGTGTHGNEYHEWTIDALATPVITNKLIDGQAAPTYTSSVGSRVGNHSQISGKQVRVSSRAEASNNIGYASRLAYDVMMRQQECKRDVEAGMCSNLASVAGTDTTAGQSAGLGAWIATNTEFGSGGSAGGFSGGTVAAPTVGTAAALTETKVRNVAESIYNEGGNPTMALCRPAVARKFSEYLFSSSARVATLTSDVGGSKSSATATGSVNVFVTDFGVVLEITPSRIMQDYATDESCMFLIDPNYLEVSYLRGYRVEPLAKTGLSENRLLSVDWTLVCKNEKAHGMICSIDNTAAVTA